VTRGAAAPLVHAPRRLIHATLVLGLVAVLLLAACSSNAASDAAPATPGIFGRPVVAVSFPILADIVSNVAGDHAEVWSVIPPSGDPHTYQALPRDLVRLAESDLLITVGGHLERFSESGTWRRAARDADLRAVELADQVDLIVRDLVIDHGDHTHDLRQGDPHFWLDPHFTLEVIGVVRSALADLDPANAEAYRAQAEAYAAAIREADAELAAAVEAIPPDRRILVVHHDAYTYLAARFGFTVLGYVLPSAGAGEASASDIAGLHRLVEEYSVPAVFREPQFEARILEALAEERGIAVGILLTDVLTDDAPTYLDFIRFNAVSLRTHLAP